MMRLSLLAVLGLLACGTKPFDQCGGCAEAGFGVAPGDVVDTATDTSAAQLDRIHVYDFGSGDLLWRATLQQPAAWLTLQPDSGFAGDSVLTLRLDPTGLAVGTYNDSVLVAGQKVFDVVAVSVTLQIH